VSVAIPEPTITTRNPYRFGTFVLAIIVAVTVLSTGMGRLQLFQAPQSYTVTTSQAETTVSVPSSRGLVYDANGTVLATNIPNFVVQVVPHDLPLDQKTTVVERLSALLGMDPLAIDSEIDGATGSIYNPVDVATNVKIDVARVIDENHDQLPGVRVVSEPIRQYPLGALYGNILGYTGLLTEVTPADKDAGYSLYDTVGKSGLELSYESQLRGTFGKESVALDENGQPIEGLYAPISSPVPGSSLKLSLNTQEQQYAYKALAWGIKAAKVKMGVIIVENPQNGEILAMVSLPGYDDNVMTNISTADYQALVNDPTGPTINKAVSEQYAPGSTYKLVAGTAGLASGVITPNTIIKTGPYIVAGANNDKFYEWNKVGFGPLNIYGGLAHSSDTFFYQLTQMIGLDRLTQWAHNYGFGKKTGIDLPNEASGIVPDDQWKQVNQGSAMLPGDLLYAGIGQGYDTVTPLQLLNAYCAMINGGYLWTPHVVTQIMNPDGTVTPVPPKLITTNGDTNGVPNNGRLPTSQAVLGEMRLATRTVVTSKHTYDMVDLPIAVAGKTGTAEYGIPDKYGRLPYHEWFVGYTLANPHSTDFLHSTDSQLAVVAFVFGANTWGDVSTEIVKYYLWEHYHLRGSPTNARYPGYIYSWITKTTNFYGSANNH
jgi:penicillin-binding protein 2